MENMALGNVQETLLLPLWGRAVETRKAKPLLVDPRRLGMNISDALKVMSLAQVEIG